LTQISSKIRKDFPFFDTNKNRANIIYFDNAATTQKPRVVINAVSDFYSSYNSNVHRGGYLLANRATEMFELTRELIQKYINSKSKEEIIFTSGTTQSVNLVAHSFIKKFLKKGDTILVSKMEHHSNIVPWQLACKQYGLKIKELALKIDGTINLNFLKKIKNTSIKLIVFQHVSNVTGAENNIKEIINVCKKHNIYTFIDGAQAIAHKKIDVQSINCDFYCFSGHKCLGPTGTGILFGKKELLEIMPPYMGGGEMIDSVNLQNSSWNKLPYKFEAGTPNIAGFIGLGKAFLYLKKIGLHKINALEQELINTLYKELKKIENIVFYSSAQGSTICTFNIKGIHSYDLGALLNEQGVCVRTGHLCAQPATKLFKTNSFIRISLSFYNTQEEIFQFITCLNKSIKILLK